jgi:hypothetical protein
MWIIQGDVLLSLPDGAPIPPGSTKVEPPADFRDDPRRYVIEAGKFILNRKARNAARPNRRAETQLTAEEVAKVRAAIKAGKI